MAGVAARTFLGWRDAVNGLPEPYRSDPFATVFETLAFAWFTIGSLAAAFGWIVGLAVESYRTK